MKVDITKYFESPIVRNSYVNEFLINNREISGIRTGRDEKEGYFVKYQEKMAGD